MAKSSKGTVSEFLVTFFIEDQIVSRLLNEVIKNRDDILYKNNIGLPNDFEIPFFQEDSENGSVYTLQRNMNSRYEVMLNNQPIEHHVINSGDYLVFKNRSNNTSIKMLFIKTSEIKAAYKKYKLSKDTNIYIGRASDNEISFDFNHYISRDRHAVIKIDGKRRAVIEDLKHTVGIYVNHRLTHSQVLQLYDEIYMMGLSIIYMGDFIAVRELSMESSLSVMQSFSVKIPVEKKKESKPFVSSPRILKSLEDDEIEIDGPPNPSTMDKTPAILVIGPSFTMALVMMASLSVSISNALKGGQQSTVVASAIMAVGMLISALLWPLLLRRYQKKKNVEDEYYRKERYSLYISGIEEKLEEKRNRSISVLNESLSPSPEILCSFLDNEKNRLRLWERSYEDADFLAVRLGLGSRPFDVHIKIPRQGFQLHEDELRQLPVELSEKYGILKNVPLALDIRQNNTVGIIGSEDHIRLIIEEIALNIISLHAYDEVKLVFVVPSKQAEQFEPLKNVPHVWSNDKRVRYFATNSDEVHYIFNVIDDDIKEREESDDKNIPMIPHYVLMITEPELVEKEALLRYVQNTEQEFGLTAVFAYGDIAKLPKFCQTIIQSDEKRTGYYTKNKNANRFIPFKPDSIEETKVREFTNKLSHLPIKKDSRTLGIADSVTFLEMYKVGNVDELDIERYWDNNNSAKSLAAPIGVMAGGELFNLDIHESYHGCHGLVAGTTGSGKSEFLQAFILSLAINYSPKEIAFVLIDFKGGDMARPFMAKTYAPALPHLSATISNLSGNVLYRALVSLEAEIKSRQRIFNEAAASLGVDKLDINSYHKYYKGGRLEVPLPHLVIIIDEFAQLKTQRPDFLEQLINVAQVGRSLGIHLILATQKPSGIVDPQIMSNSRFKVCLKVAEKQDSVDMLNKPDAALIKNPGRLYLQVGYNEIYEYIQSGYSGADYVPSSKYVSDEEITVQMTDNTAQPIHSAKMELAGAKSDKSQLEAVVAKIVALGQKKHVSAKSLWLDMLPEKVFMNALKREKRGLCSAVIGLADYVRTQEQKTLSVDFSKIGHMAIYGASGTGKTTFLQSLVYSMVCEYQYTPDELNIYAMDFGGRNMGYLAKLPHTGGVVFADDEAGVSDLAITLSDIIEERKRLFAMNNCGTFIDYRSVSQKPLPAIMVLIDNFASFRDKYMDVADQFVEIISAGRTFGVYFVITGTTKNSIYYKVTEQIAAYFTLKLNDPNTYLDIFNVRPPIVPEDISGRGITAIGREIVEFQTALALDSQTEADRLLAISEKYDELSAAWKGAEPVKLSNEVSDDSQQAINYTVSVSNLSEKQNNLPDAITNDQYSFVLGSSKSGALEYGISLFEDYKVCICSNGIESMAEYYQKFLGYMVEYSDRKVIFIDDNDMNFLNITEQYGDCRYIAGSVEFGLFIEDFKDVLNDRLENPDAMHEPIFMVVSEFNKFFDMITDEQADFMRKVFQYIDDPKYGIYFICGFDVNGEKNNDRLFMSLIVNAENYVICGNSYEKASQKIESLMAIRNVRQDSSYLCLKDKSVEIRW